MADAEQAYVLASERGRDPQPGLALLRLAQGRVDLAAAASAGSLIENSSRTQPSSMEGVCGGRYNCFH